MFILTNVRITLLLVIFKHEYSSKHTDESKENIDELLLEKIKASFDTKNEKEITNKIGSFRNKSAFNIKSLGKK